MTTKETEVKFHVEERKYSETELIGDIDRWSFYLNMLIVLSKFNLLKYVQDYLSK